jgi:APA family basic amino acid/polyamine antiporter
MTAPIAPLERRLGLDSAVAVVVGEVIGVGIFLSPAEMARGLGSPFWLLAVWLAVGLAAGCGALCYGELAARYPQAGGGYVYLREAWGERAAFLYGWKSLLVMDPGLTAALAAGACEYVGYLTPLSGARRTGFAILLVLVLSLVNALGVRVGAAVLRALTLLKVLLLAVIVGWGFASGRGEWSHFVPFVAPRPGAAPLVGGLAGALVGAFFSIGGFWDVAKLAGEVRDPARTLPRALALGVGGVTLVYVLTSAVFVYLVPMDQATSAPVFVARAGEALFGPLGGRVLAGGVVLAVVGSLAAVMISAPRVYLAMARDGLFLRPVGELHPRLGTPVRAIAIQAALAALLVSLGTFGDIVAYFIFVTVAFVALTVAGIYRLPRLPRSSPDSYRIPGYPATPLGFLALLAMILALLAAGRPRQALLGTAVVLLGIPVHALVAARRRRAATLARITEEN